jgi:hypothetical protein
MNKAADLLLAILRQGPERTVPALESWTASDWQAILASAPPSLHPYLAFRLQTLCAPGRIPAPIHEALFVARRAGVVGHLQRQALLRQMANALAEGEVPFVVLKGMALAHLAYPEPGLRPMGDIDLWTRPEHLEAAARALLKAGLRYPERRVSRTPAATRPEAAPTRVLEWPGSGLIVELHGEVKSMRAIAENWEGAAWARRVPASLGGVEVDVLAAGDMLTHLSIHCGAHHRFEFGLRALLDIALWLECSGDQLDWPTLQREWEQDGTGTWVYLTLTLARELLGAPVPEEYFRNADRPAHSAELLTLARAQILDATKTMPPALTRLSTLPSLGERLHWLSNRVTTWYWTGPDGAQRKPLEALREAGKRMAHDLRYKIPPYLRGLLGGSRRGEELRERRELAAGRERMAELVALERQARVGS